MPDGGNHKTQLKIEIARRGLTHKLVLFRIGFATQSDGKKTTEIQNRSAFKWNAARPNLPMQ